MGKFKLFLVSLLPLQFWGMLIFFIYAVNPTSIKTTINTLVILSYNVLVNSLEALALATFVWLLSFLIPRSFSREKRVVIQLGIVAAIVLAGLLSQLLQHVGYPLPQWDLLVYVAINLVNTKLYRRIFFVLEHLIISSLLTWLVVLLFRSGKEFSQVDNLLDSLMSLAWLYIGLDVVFLFIIVLRWVRVI